MNPFIQDGHKIVFKLEKDEVAIVRVDCPHDGGGKGICNQRSFCVVRRFINSYGVETCLGQTLIDGPVEIAWSERSGESDLPDVGMVYYCPINDPEYKEMLTDLELSRDDGPGPKAIV